MTLPDGATVTDRLLAPPNMLLNIDIVRKIASGRRYNVENSTKVKSYRRNSLECLNVSYDGNRGSPNSDINRPLR